MADKLLGREQTVTFKAFNASGEWVRVEGRHIESDAFAKAFVIYFECKQLFHQSVGTDERLGRVAVQEGRTQSLGIRFGDETTTGRRRWDDSRGFEYFQLIVSTARAEDLQLIAHAVDLLKTEFTQNCGQDLRQTKSFLSADSKTRNGFVF